MRRHGGSPDLAEMHSVISVAEAVVADVLVDALGVMYLPDGLN